MGHGLASKVRRRLARLRLQEERIYQIADIIESEASARDKVKAIEELLDAFTDLFRIESTAEEPTTYMERAKKWMDEWLDLSDEQQEVPALAAEFDAVAREALALLQKRVEELRDEIRHGSLSKVRLEVYSKHGMKMEFVSRLTAILVSADAAKGASDDVAR